MRQRIGVNAFWLKLFMAGLMLLDHLYLYIPGTPPWFTWAGRLVAPTFCYLMTQGLIYTRNRWRYIQRLGWAALVMVVGSQVLSIVFERPLAQNIFLSLWLSGVLIWQLERIQEKGGTIREWAIVALLLGCSVFFEGALLLPVMAVIFYFLRHRPVVMGAAYCAAMLPLIWFLTGGVIFPQVLMLLALVPIYLYNGRRGPNGPVARWFFYLFYPLHIWILFAVNMVCYPQ